MKNRVEKSDNEIINILHFCQFSKKNGA